MSNEKNDIDFLNLLEQVRNDLKTKLKLDNLSINKAENEKENSEDLIVSFNNAFNENSTIIDLITQNLNTKLPSKYSASSKGPVFIGLSMPLEHNSGSTVVYGLKCNH